MCGIVGLMLRHPGKVGDYIYRMLLALQHRGTDSAGVAIYTDKKLGEDEYILMVQVLDKPGAIGKVGDAIGCAGGNIRDIRVTISKGGGFGIDRYVVRAKDLLTLERIVEGVDATSIGKVFSYGQSIQVIKETGLVENLEASYDISGMRGTHGIGHVRFSTESRVDHHHAHPFHTGANPDIAVVHNGQITNYYKVRRELERRGFTFVTENDTECIVHFIVDKLQQKFSFEEALEASVEELDGPFSYIIATSTAIGVARDKLGLRPAMIAHDKSGYFIASEECALVGVCEDPNPKYLGPGEVCVYELKSS